MKRFVVPITMLILFVFMILSCKQSDKVVNIYSNEDNDLLQLIKQSGQEFKSEWKRVGFC